MVGRTLGHYKIIEKLGAGGMGEVYRARDLKLGREVALKVLSGDLSGDPERRKRFEREARAVAALKHPNIVTLHAIEEAEGITFIAMELVEGKTLAEILGGKGLPLDKLFTIAVPLAEALAAAHAKGIAHRDLKPANVMIDADGRLKVLDFGLAKLLERDRESEQTIGPDSHTAEGNIVGTVAYMSPEQAEGGAVDHRTDIFSLGVVLYEMATGQRPFQGKTSISIISSILKDTPPSVSEIRATLPRHLGRIISHCLVKEPDRRYQSAQDVRNELEGLRAEITSGIVEGPARTMPSVPASRRVARKVAIGATVGLVLILAGTITLRVLRQKSGGAPASGSDGGASSTEGQSIAVLPFVNMSGERDNEYFSDGLSEEILNVLAKVPGLRVAARTSSFHFKGMTGDVAEIGRQLHVATILEGSVRRAGDRVRVTAQLVKAGDGFHVWSDTYDRHIQDIFAIQEEIAGQVVEALKIKLLGGPVPTLVKSRTQNLEAYEAYLFGQQRLATRRTEALKEAASHFQQAIELDPNYAQAHAGLALAYWLQTEYGALSTSQALGKAMPEVERALALDPRLGEAHAILGVIKNDRGELEAAEASFRRAIELNPNDPMAFMWYARQMSDRDLEKRHELIQKALALDPLSPVIHANIGYFSAEEGKVQQAIDEFNRAIAIDPSFVSAYQGLATIYADHLDRLDEALEYRRRAVAADPGNLRRRLALGGSYYAAGRSEEALATFEEIVNRDPAFAPAYAAVANYYYDHGRIDESVRWILRARERDPENYDLQLGDYYLLLDDEPSAKAAYDRIEREHPGTKAAKFGRGNLAEFRGDLAGMESIALEIAATSPAAVLDALIDMDVAAGRFHQARERAMPFHRNLLESSDPNVDGATVHDAVHLCFVLRGTGENDRFETLLRGAEAFLASRPPEVRRNRFAWVPFRILVLRGRLDEAIDVAKRAIEGGSFIPWWETFSPSERAVAGDPRWRALMSAERETLRKQKRALEASGRGQENAADVSKLSP